MAGLSYFIIQIDAALIASDLAGAVAVAVSLKLLEQIYHHLRPARPAATKVSSNDLIERCAKTRIIT